MSSRKYLLDRSKYPQRTISTYQIISAYIVDIYYNSLYAEAVKFKEGKKVSSVTEGYKHAVYRFLSVVDSSNRTNYNHKHYKSLLIGINKCFTMWTSFETLTLSDCIDKIVHEFVPDDYYESLDKDQKRNILRIVLIDVLTQFTKMAVCEFLHIIIDNHDEIANVEILKEKIVDILLMEREAFYHKFLSTKMSKKSEYVDKEIAVKMKNEIQLLLTENANLKTAKSTIENECIARKNQLSQVITKYKMLVKKYKGLKDEYEALLDKTENEPQPQPQPELQSQIAYMQQQMSRLLQNQNAPPVVNYKPESYTQAHITQKDVFGSSSYVDDDDDNNNDDDNSEVVQITNEPNVEPNVELSDEPSDELSDEPSDKHMEDLLKKHSVVDNKTSHSVVDNKISIRDKMGEEPSLYDIY